MRFTKMQGCGNDYIYIEEKEIATETDLNKLSQRLSDRHYGIGGDGIVIIGYDGKALRMRIFNQDGSEAEMCGNASRCVGRYAIENDWWNGEGCITMHTKAGEKQLRGKKTAAGITIEVKIGKGVCKTIDVDGKSATEVMVGNPHCVFFTDQLEDIRLEIEGRTVENNTLLFPDRTNVEYAQILDEHHIKLMVWERGSGATLACGTGATATALAAVESGRCTWPVTLDMPGGQLQVTEETGDLWLGGGAEIVFRGEIQ